MHHRGGDGGSNVNTQLCIWAYRFLLRNCAFVQCRHHQVAKYMSSSLLSSRNVVIFEQSGYVIRRGVRSCPLMVVARPSRARCAPRRGCCLGSAHHGG